MKKLLIEIIDTLKKLDEKKTIYKEKLVEYEVISWQKDLVRNYDDVMMLFENNKALENRYRSMTRLIDKDNKYPLSNDDTIKKNNLRRNLPNYRKKYEWNNNIWLPCEIKKLRKLVEIHLLKSILEVKIKLGFKNYNISDTNEDGYETSDKFVELNRLVKKLSEKDDLFNIDSYWTEFWNLISLDLGNRCERTGKDCQITWYHYIDPNINRKPWEKNEDLRLLALVSENKGFNWTKIAQELNSGRTPYQCILRYQRSLNKNLIKSNWTVEEDKKLLSIVDSLGGFDVLEMNKRSTSKWNIVANLLPGRTNQQCRARYVRSLKKDLKHGSWSLYEDVRLQFVFFIYGGNCWIKISRHISGRSDSKCRERYVNMLLPDIKKGKWSQDENNMLISAVNRFGPGNWSLIKNFVIGRTDADCSKQWEKLDPNSSFQYDVLRATQRHMLPQSYKWIGLTRSNHKLLSINYEKNQNFDKNDFIKPKLTGSDFFIEPAQNLLNIAQYIIHNYNNTHNYNLDINFHQLIQQIENFKTNDYKSDQILLKIKRSLINFIKKKQFSQLT